MLKKLLAVLVIFVLFITCFSACNSNKEDIPDNTETTEKPTEGTPIATAKTAVKVIYPDGSSKKLALKIQDKILSDKGASLENLSFCTLSTDKKTQDDGTFEILVGHTDRALSAEARTELKTYLDFAVIYKDNKLAISANNDTRLADAVEYVLSKLTVKDDKVEYSGSEKYVQLFENYELPDLSVAGVAISEFQIIYPANANNAEKNLAATLGDWVMSMSGAIIDIKDDSNAEIANEILIGKTNRSLSAEAAGDSAIPDAQYVSVVKDGKLAINADSGSGYTSALGGFQTAMTKNNGQLTEAFGSQWLTFDEIRAISVGSPNIQEKDRALWFYKCTDAQMAAYRAQSEGMGNNATTSTGVRLDFTTDSSTFGFKAVSGFSFELYINGEFKEQITNPTANPYSIALDTSKGENRITLFFPNDSVGALSMVQIDLGASLERQKFDTTLLIIGDSITQAWPTAIDSYGYGHLISMHYNADSIIYGVGGGIFDASTLDYYGDDFKPDVITVAYGTNDWDRSYSRDTLTRNMKAFLDKLISFYPDAQIVGISPLWRTDFDKNKSMTFDEARKLIEDIYKEYGIIAIDGDDMMPHDSKYLADNVHPNDEGHKEYAKNLIEKLDTLLK